MTTLTQTEATVTVRTEISHLHNAVKNVVHFAAPTNMMVPILSAGHLFIRNGVLVLEATDRYKLIQIKVQDLRQMSDDQDSGYDGWDQDIGVIPLADLKALEQTLRADARNKQQLTVTLSYFEDREVLEMQHAITGSIQRIQLYTESQYPKLQSLYYDVLPAEVSDFKIMGLEHMQAMAKIQHTRYKKNNQKMHIHGSRAAKPFAVFWVANGEVWAQGLMMPIKSLNNDESWTLGSQGTYF